MYSNNFFTQSSPGIQYDRGSVLWGPRQTELIMWSNTPKHLEVISNTQSWLEFLIMWLAIVCQAISKMACCVGCIENPEVEFDFLPTPNFTMQAIQTLD